MGKRAERGWHSLSELDLEGRTAVCSVCGPTEVVPPRPGKVSAQCITARRRQRNNRSGPRTHAQRAAAVAAQGGRCAICNAAPASLVDDHDHLTGAPRDMLCARCNRVLGAVGEDVGILHALAAYVVRHREAQAI